MALIDIIQTYLNTSNIQNEQEFIINLIEQLEFLYDLYSYGDDDSDYSEVFTEDESDEEPFTPEELQELDNVRVGRNGEFYFIN
tara:strand:- start:357 stop:608 length:252 start_codon:yes stop_codon:yes gene_type:complete